LADELLYPWFDSDQFYWENWPIDFLKKREPRVREEKLNKALLGKQDWILSGSIDGWDSPLEQHFTHLIFLYLEPKERLRRLRLREIERFGETAIAPGGSQYEHAEYFLSWTAHYDDGTLPGRSLLRHHAWMNKIRRPLLKLNSSESVINLVDCARHFLIP